VCLRLSHATKCPGARSGGRGDVVLSREYSLGREPLVSATALVATPPSPQGPPAPPRLRLTPPPQPRPPPRRPDRTPLPRRPLRRPNAPLPTTGGGCATAAAPYSGASRRCVLQACRRICVPCAPPPGRCGDRSSAAVDPTDHHGRWDFNVGPSGPAPPTV